MECAEDSCENEATVELHIPWAENRRVCSAHARTLSREDGVVADPIEGKEDAWP